jgi:hypothetical protein
MKRILPISASSVPEQPPPSRSSTRCSESWTRGSASCPAVRLSSRCHTAGCRRSTRPRTSRTRGIVSCWPAGSNVDRSSAPSGPCASSKSTQALRSRAFSRCRAMRSGSSSWARRRSMKKRDWRCTSNRGSGARRSHARQRDTIPPSAVQGKDALASAATTRAATTYRCGFIQARSLHPCTNEPPGRCTSAPMVVRRMVPVPTFSAPPWDYCPVTERQISRRSSWWPRLLWWMQSLWNQRVGSVAW